MCQFVRRGLATWLLCAGIVPAATATAEIRLQPQELDTRLQVGYAVRVLDVNGDQQLDIAIVDSKRVLWLEGPTWKEHVIYETPNAQFDNVCFAPHDIDGDGRVDFALGADWQFGNSDSGGSIGWLQHTPRGPWIYHPLASEPTTHRMQWIALGDAQEPALIVAPLKGRGSRPPGFDQVGIRLLAFSPPANPLDMPWPVEVLTDQLHVMHNLDECDLDGDGQSEIMAASYEGATWIRRGKQGDIHLKRLGAGQQEPAPKRGASEIRVGRLAGGRPYLATIEPWHGDKVVVYVAPQGWTADDAKPATPQSATAQELQSATASGLWPRSVLDEQLAWGHAVACADLDGDADQELIIGIRDDQNDAHRRGLRIYDPQPASADASGQVDWQRSLHDPGGVAIEDLTVGDLDGDGDNDIVAVGRATHNVKIYWNQQASPQP